MSAKELNQAKAQFSVKYRMLRDFYNSVKQNRSTVASRVANRNFQKYYPKFIEAFELITLHKDQFVSSEGQQEFEVIQCQCSEVNSMLTEVEELITPTPSGSEELSSDIQVRAQLPSIQLPKFSGDNLDWLSFRDLFQSLVDIRANLSDSEKHYYLRTSLSNEALSVIQHLPMDSVNYKTAWTLLQQRYDNSRSLADSYLDRIFRLPNISPNTSIRREFYDPLRESTQALRKLNLPVSEWSYLLVFIILQKLPIRLRHIFEERYGKFQDQLPTFDQLMELLDEQCRLQLAVPVSQNPSGSQPSPFRRSPVFQRGPKKAVAATVQPSGNSGQNQVTCMYCNGQTHSLYKCKGFLEIHPYQRRVWAAKEQLCQTCLRRHPGNQCAHRYWCKHCNSGKHNTLLCFQDANKHQNEAHYQNQAQKRDRTPPQQRQMSQLQSSLHKARISPNQMRQSSPVKEESSPETYSNQEEQFKFVPGQRRPGQLQYQANLQFEKLRYGRRSPSPHSN